MALRFKWRKERKKKKVQSSFLCDLNNATNVRPNVLLLVRCTQMFPGLRLDNHYAYQKHFIRGIRSEAERERQSVFMCISVLIVSVCVSMLVGLSPFYMQVTIQEQK